MGIGNIAGVAIAIHLGGPGALFWMWVTAFLGMATKWARDPDRHPFADEAMSRRFTGVVRPGDGDAVTAEGETLASLWGNAPDSGAPLTMEAFSRGLPGSWGNVIVLVSTILFGISTAISWGY